MNILLILFVLTLHQVVVFVCRGFCHRTESDLFLFFLLADVAIQTEDDYWPRTSSITSAFQVFMNVYHVTLMFVGLIYEASVTVMFVFYFPDFDNIAENRQVRKTTNTVLCIFVLFLYCLHLSSCTKYCTNIQIVRKAASENIQHYSSKNIHFTNAMYN